VVFNDRARAGLLLGNGGNWPLMKTIRDASGGVFAQVMAESRVAY